MPLGEVIGSVLELIFEVVFNEALRFLVRGLGWLIIKCVTLGRAKSGFDSPAALVVGLMGWASILVGLYWLFFI
jgi:hypothetical protein